MKKILIQITAGVLLLFAACDKNTDWAEGTLSPIISIEDLRLLYKGTSVSLNSNNLSGATQISGLVIADAAAGNVPNGVLIMQNTNRKKTRGISIDMGAAANSYQLGDSIVVTVNGATLKNENGRLEIVGVTASSVKLIAQQHTINAQNVTLSQLKANPGDYESTLVNIYSGDFNPTPVMGETFSGDKIFNDGSAQISFHTEVGANFANRQLPSTASVTAIALPYQVASATAPEISLWPRNSNDIKEKLIILAWNLLGALGNEVSSTSNIVNVNMEPSVLSRGAGITAAAAGGSFASTFPINVDKAAAIAANAYYQFSLKPKGKAKISLAALDAIFRIQTNAAKTYIWTYSLDGGISFKDIKEPYTWTTGFSENNGIQQPQIDLSHLDDFKNITAEKPVIFRLYAWGGTSIASNNGFRIGKSLTAAQHSLAIGGTVIEQHIP
ncbi:DUF5689 domain-containing protein [Pedobacter sp. ASV28]|uniref:DUF5689 domain-containing protein n=1 Tax=Pedobacter sp. ASV28 TaxID=2795123 RepID=UPI0018EAB8D5|nr:DUF5689 domain-containing protein [Pedobacter sp. ASV28]